MAYQLKFTCFFRFLDYFLEYYWRLNQRFYWLYGHIWCLIKWYPHVSLIYVKDREVVLCYGTGCDERVWKENEFCNKKQTMLCSACIQFVDCHSMASDAAMMLVWRGEWLSCRHFLFVAEGLICFSLWPEDWKKKCQNLSVYMSNMLMPFRSKSVGQQCI